MATAHQKLGYQFDKMYLQVAMDHFSKNAVPASSSIVMSDTAVTLTESPELFSKVSQECELTDGLTFIAKLDFGGMRHFSELPILFVKIVTFSVNSLRQWVGRQRRRTPLEKVIDYLILFRKWKNNVCQSFLMLDNGVYQVREEVAL